MKTKAKRAVTPVMTPPKRSGKRGIRPLEAEELVVPKQKDLPGMETRHIQELEDAALNYVSVRDRRMALTEKEVDLKGVLLQVMKRNQKSVYRVEEMEIRIVAKDETVKVKILKDKE